MTQREAKIKKWQKKIEEAKHLQEKIIKNYDMLDLVINELERKIRFERNINRGEEK